MDDHVRLPGHEVLHHGMYLPLTKSEVRSELPQFAKVIVGVIIKASDGAILLIRRAATEQFFPNSWELPSGNMETKGGTDEEETVKDTALREALEETGLWLNSGSLRPGPNLTWISSRGANIQLNYYADPGAECENLDGRPRITLNPDEHSEWRWFTRSMLSQLPRTDITNEMRECVSRCFGPVI